MNEDQSRPARRHGWPRGPVFTRSARLGRGPRLLLRALVVGAAVATVVLVARALPGLWARTDIHRDMMAYYRVAERLRADGPMYWPLPTMEPQRQTVWLYLYPPFFGAAMRLWPATSWLVFARAWTLLVAAGALAYVLLLARLAAGRLTVTGVCAALIAVVWCPGTFDAIAFGQVDPLLWALLGVALVWGRARGAALAASGLVKPFTVVALCAAALRERRRVILPAVAVLVAATALATLLLGPRALWLDCATWLRSVAPSLAQGTWNGDNLSLSFAPLRLLRAGGWLSGNGPLPGAATAYLTLAGLLAPAAVAVALRRRSAAVQCATTVATAIVFAPICWTTYLPALLAPVAAWWREIAPDAGRSSG